MQLRYGKYFDIIKLKEEMHNLIYMKDKWRILKYLLQNFIFLLILVFIHLISI